MTLTAMEAGTGFSNGKISKRQQHSWGIKNERGHFEWIHKSELEVDARYQREEISKGRVAVIRRDWSWVGCGVLIVALRPDGSLLVIDGQHRKLAADNRDDIQDLPCMVFEIGDIAKEAQGFIDANTVRGPVRAVHKFKAQLVANDAISVAVKEMVEASGYSVTSGGGGRNTVSCVKLLSSSLALDPATARKVWNLCVELHAGECIENKIFGALFVAERLLAKSDHSLFDRHNSDALRAAGIIRIKQNIFDAHNYYKKHGSKIAAQGIINLLNYRRPEKSSRRIPNVA